MSKGAMTAREMELIALGISLAVRCKPCINLYVEKCLEVDGTLEQILKAAGVALVMQGESALTHVEPSNPSRFGLAARYRVPAGYETT